MIQLPYWAFIKAESLCKFHTPGLTSNVHTALGCAEMWTQHLSTWLVDRCWVHISAQPRAVSTFEVSPGVAKRGFWLNFLLFILLVCLKQGFFLNILWYIYNIYVCVHMCMCVCMYVWECMCCVYVYVHMYVCMRVYVCVCVCFVTDYKTKIFKKTKDYKILWFWCVCVCVVCVCVCVCVCLNWLQNKAI